MITIEEIKKLNAERTQSPWHLSEKGFQKRLFVPTVYTADTDLRYITFCNDQWVGEGNELTDNLANAKFIAAAPQIAALCIQQAELLEEYRKDLEFYSDIKKSMYDKGEVAKRILKEGK